MRISDWSSDVCSSDLHGIPGSPNTISVGARRAIGSVIETGFGGWMMTVFGTPLSAGAKRVLLLGSGELGKEVVIELQRYGVETIAVDRYANAPAMQLAHRSHVIDMLDGAEIRRVIELEQPDLIVPAIEAIHTPTLQIGRAHVRTPVTNAHPVCRLLL